MAGIPAHWAGPRWPLRPSQPARCVICARPVLPLPALCLLCVTGEPRSCGCRAAAGNGSTLLLSTLGQVRSLGPCPSVPFSSSPCPTLPAVTPQFGVQLPAFPGPCPEQPSTAVEQQRSHRAGAPCQGLGQWLMVQAQLLGWASNSCSHLCLCLFDLLVTQKV